MKPVIEVDTDETQRQNFRVQPHKDDPISLAVAGANVSILDISAKGVAFKYPGEIKHDVYSIVLRFETDRAYEVNCRLRIVRRAKPEYSGEFVHISERDITHITSFVVACQKWAIRRSRQVIDENK